VFEPKQRRLLVSQARELPCHGSSSSVVAGRAVPANSGTLCETMDWGPGGLVKDHEYQAIPVGKCGMLCESTNVRSHTSAMCCVKAQMLEVTRVTGS